MKVNWGIRGRLVWCKKVDPHGLKANHNSIGVAVPPAPVVVCISKNRLNYFLMTT